MSAADTDRVYHTITDPDTRHIARDIGRLGGTYNGPTQTWIFGGSDYFAPDGTKRESSPVSDKADALLELYRFTRPLPEQLKQLEETAKVVPLKAFGISARPGSAEAKAELAKLLNPNVTSKTRVEYILNRTAGYTLAATEDQKNMIASLIERGYDKLAWGFDAKAESGKVWQYEGAAKNVSPTTARALELMNLATPFVRADQRRAQYELEKEDKAMLAGDVENAAGGIDYTKVSGAQQERLADRVAAEKRVADKRMESLENSRYTKEQPGIGRAAQEARELSKNSERMGFGVANAELGAPKAALEVATQSLAYQIGEYIAATTTHNADDAVVRDPRPGTTLKGTAAIFVKINDSAAEDHFLIGVQHKTSAKTWTKIDSASLSGYNVSMDAPVEIKFTTAPEYRVFSDGAALSVERINDPAVIEALNKKALAPVGDVGTLATVKEYAETLAKERELPVTIPKIDQAPVQGEVTFSGIGRKVREQINALAPEAAFAIFGVKPQESPDFWATTPQFEATRRLNAASAFDPGVALREEARGVIAALSNSGSALIAEIPHNVAERGEFSGKVIALGNGEIAVDRGFNRFSVVPLAPGAKIPKPGDLIKVSTTADASVTIAPVKAQRQSRKISAS